MICWADEKTGHGQHGWLARTGVVPWPVTKHGSSIDIYDVQSCHAQDSWSKGQKYPFT